MTDLLNGKTAVVTGGSSGIGRGISLAMAEWGADVVVGDLRAHPLGGGIPTHELIERDTEASSTFLTCDATDRTDVTSLVDTAEQFTGVDIMVNNVGGGELEHGTAFTAASDEDFTAIVSYNLKTAFLGSQAAATRMMDGDGGAIINISSIDGIHGDGAIPLYSAAKGGVRLLTYSLASALGQHEIRVNAIHPGLIKTYKTTDDNDNISEGRIKRFAARTALDRVGTPRDIGHAAVFLGSDLSSYITGHSLVVDGGIVTTQA